MGVSISLHVYDYFELIKSIDLLINEEPDRIPEGRTLNEFVEKILPEFGIRAGDKYVTLWNEYYEDYNAGVELFRAVELYFGLDDVFLGGYNSTGNANAEEVLESLGIKPIGVDEDDEY